MSEPWMLAAGTGICLGNPLAKDIHAEVEFVVADGVASKPMRLNASSWAAEIQVGHARALHQVAACRNSVVAVRDLFTSAGKTRHAAELGHPRFVDGGGSQPCRSLI